MDKHYYFIAQLPTLIFGQAPQIDRQYFLSEAEKWLSNKDFIFISQIHISDCEPSLRDNIYLRKYKEFELDLRQALVSFRKKIQDYRLRGQLNEALSGSSPLEIEKKLLKLRWDFVDNLQTDNNFNLGYLTYYFLKLQILEKFFVFNKEKGRENFNSLCEVK
ncbi:MAG: DUF2764 family protein [Candidatus Omnitrophica bacterium]|nr:DUF2764 family protein [Candidatus Omnitrophota bacterium]MDD5429459.1 DUF2764 family protein [Candidatus Omnitrophota bacterium]